MKKKTRVGAVLCCSTALVTILGGYFLTNRSIFNWGKPETNQNQMITNSDIQTTEILENMSVKLLKKTTNNDGSISYEYSYSVLPEGSTRKDITGNLFFIDESEGIDDYLIFTIDEVKSTFTITKKADFSHQAKLELSCNANPNVKASITIDCKQYFKGFNNVNEKTYHQLLSDENSVLISDIETDGGTTIDANYFSTEYTIPINAQYRIDQVKATLNGYVTGDDIESMSDSGVTITDSFTIAQADLKGDFTLENLQNAVYNDSAFMEGTDAYTFSQSAYFGVSYDLAITYNSDNAIKVFTAHMIAVAETSDLDFGVPTEIDVESDTVIFNDVETEAKFIFTDEYGCVYFYEATNAGDSGWLSTDQHSLYNGYINIEITRRLDGKVISGPTLLFSDNDGKGFYTGAEHISQYVVYNPGGYEDVAWSNVKEKYTDNFYRITKYTYTINS